MKILIVEDNKHTLENLIEILELEGFESLVATDGWQGVALANTHIPDLVICDVTMPNLDGYAVLEKLAGNEATADIPFIFLTGKSTHSEFRQGMNLGANDYLTKPFVPAELVDAIHAQLRKKTTIVKAYKNQIKAIDNLNAANSSVIDSLMGRLLRDASTAFRDTQEPEGSGSPLDGLEPSQRFSISNALHYAVEHNEFEVYYQPQVDAKTDCVVGVEALLRWHSAELGAVSPAQFIPIAETIGLIDDIGTWVLWTACKQIKAWQDVMIEPISVSVNLSPVQLSRPNFIDTIRTILSKSEIKPNLLHVEITETALIKDQDCVKRSLQEIKAMGVHIAIDDFGTGYSGLEYLSHFPCDVLKLDRLFIQDIHQHQTNQRIVSAVLSMGHALNLKVVAEGAETPAELAYLKAQGCDMVQGYVYARPMPVNEISVFLDKPCLQTACC